MPNGQLPPTCNNQTGIKAPFTTQNHISPSTNNPLFPSENKKSTRCVSPTGTGFFCPNRIETSASHTQTKPPLHFYRSKGSGLRAEPVKPLTPAAAPRSLFWYVELSSPRGHDLAREATGEPWRGRASVGHPKPPVVKH